MKYKWAIRQLETNCTCSAQFHSMEGAHIYTETNITHLKFNHCSGPTWYTKEKADFIDWFRLGERKWASWGAYRLHSCWRCGLQRHRRHRAFRRSVFRTWQRNHQIKEIAWPGGACRIQFTHQGLWPGTTQEASIEPEKLIIFALLFISTLGSNSSNVAKCTSHLSAYELKM